MSNDIDKNIVTIVISSSTVIFLLFLTSILFKVEFFITFMFTIPITIVSSTGMAVSYKQQSKDARTDKFKRLPRKTISYQSKAKPSKELAAMPRKSKAKLIKPSLGKPTKIKTKKVESIEGKQFTAEELLELKKTESEVDIQEQKFTCIVHKGPIIGNLFLCPHCNTLYCNKCAKALREKGDKCCSCEKELESAKEIPQDVQKSINTLNSLISHYTIRINTLNFKFRTKSLIDSEGADKLKYLEEKEDLTEKLLKYKASLNKLKAKYMNE